MDDNVSFKGDIYFFKDDGVNVRTKEKEEKVVYRSYLFYYTKSVTLNRWRL